MLTSLAEYTDIFKIVLSSLTIPELAILLRVNKQIYSEAQKYAKENYFEFESKISINNALKVDFLFTVCFFSRKNKNLIPNDKIEKLQNSENLAYLVYILLTDDSSKIDWKKFSNIKKDIEYSSLNSEVRKVFENNQLFLDPESNGYSNQDMSHINAALFKSSFIIAEGINLTRANLVGLKLIQSNFKNSILKKALLNNSHLTENNFSDANFEEAIIENSNLTANNFDKADFTKASCAYSNFTGGTFKETSFSQTNLNQAHFDLIEGLLINPTLINNANFCKIIWHIPSDQNWKKNINKWKKIFINSINSEHSLQSLWDIFSAILHKEYFLNCDKLQSTYKSIIFIFAKKVYFLLNKQEQHSFSEDDKVKLHELLTCLKKTSTNTSLLSFFQNMQILKSRSEMIHYFQNLMTQDHFPNKKLSCNRSAL